MTKQAEREYAEKVEQGHLFRKPFNNPRVFREFATVLELFHQRLAGGSSVLDLGCGPGWTSLFLARAGFQVVGLDISERMIEIARARADEENTPVTFLVGDMEEFDLEKRDFDAVLLFDALHHCPAYTRVLCRAADHLRPGGYLLLLEPSWLHRYSPHARDITRRYGVTELGFSRSHLKRTLRRAGFRHLTQCYQDASPFCSFLGLLLASLRQWCAYLACFPRVKQIILAQK